MKLQLTATSLFTFLICASLTAQVEVDKRLQLTGADGERMLTNLEAPVNGTDAVNKDYVDAAVAALGGSSFTMISAESPSSMTFINALAYCRNLTESTHSDWQLPTIEQLLTLLSKGGNSLVIPSPSSSNFFWFQPGGSSAASSLAIIRFSDGFMTTNNFTSPSNAQYVRCIR